MRTTRKKFGLQEFDLMPALERNCTADCMDTYICAATPTGSTWAPSSARRPIRSPSRPGRWCANGSEDGRRYFEYKLDHPSLEFLLLHVRPL